MVKNRIKLIELKRAIKNRPHGYFQIIKSKKDLKEAKRQIENAREKYPGYNIPFYRVIMSDAQNQ